MMHIKTILDSSNLSWALLTVILLMPLVAMLMDSVRLSLKQPFPLLQKLPLCLLALPFLFSLSSCAGDILSEDNPTDNSVTDNHQIGDTMCSTSCTTHEDGSVEYEKICNGAQVSSGSFTDGTTCAEIIASQQEASQDEDSSDDGVSEDEAGGIGNPVNLP